MSLPQAVEDAAARVKRIRLSLDGRSASDEGSGEGSSGSKEAQEEPAAGASGDEAAAPRSPQSEDRAGEAARGESGGDSGSGGGNSGSGSDGQDQLCMLRRTKSLARLRAEEFAAPPPVSAAASAPASAEDVWDFLRAQQLDDLCTMLVSDPLSWELWAFGELNALLAANFADLPAFALQPLQAYPQVPPRPALDAFLRDVPRGPAARLLHVLLHRTFRACDEVEIVRYRFTCPPCLAAWARRHRVPPAAAQLFAVTGVDSASGEACTLYVPHIPAMQRPKPAPPADCGDSTAERCAAGEAAAAAERAANEAQPQQVTAQA